MLLLLQNLSLLLWLLLVLQVGALLEFEDAFDDGRGSSLVISSLLLWLVGLQQVFYRWLWSLEWKMQKNERNHSALSRCFSGRRPIALASCTANNAFQDFNGMFQGLESERGLRSLNPSQSGNEHSSTRSHNNVRKSVATDQSN